MLTLLQSEQLRQSGSRAASHLWEGFLVPGMVSLLTSQWKSGKTTLISVLLRQLEHGGLLAGEAVSPGRAVVVTEEHAQMWAERDRRMPFGQHVQFCCRPFPSHPSAAEWRELIIELAALPVDLVVFDPLAMFLPAGVENNSSLLLSALAPLRHLSDAGKAVQLIHHPRKQGPAYVLSPRGSGALAGFVDILAELDRPPGAAEEARVRRLRVTSRLNPPRQVEIELDEAGLNYSVVRSAVEADGFGAAWPVLEIILGDAPYRLDRGQILSYWLEDYEKPSMPTLRRWLDRATADGRIEKIGSGRKFDPFKYALTGRTDLLPELPQLETWRTKKIAEHKLILKADRAAVKMLRKKKKPIADNDEEFETDDDESVGDNEE